jgi:hypothetical protein
MPGPVTGVHGDVRPRLGDVFGDEPAASAEVG